MCFNPRARGGHDLGLTTISDINGLFQSTRPRGARPERAGLTGKDNWVSIHAPAGGATGLVSQAFRQFLCFNPRARGGRDFSPSLWWCVVGEVSIHAPAGGATQIYPRIFIQIQVSIHAPAGGAT